MPILRASKGSVSHACFEAFAGVLGAPMTWLTALSLLGQGFFARYD